MNRVNVIIAGIPSTVLVVLICLSAYHWIESGENLTTGVRMTVQDVKVGVSCRNIDIAARFIGRRYEDNLLDRQLFKLPGWKLLICPIYEQEAVRTAQYRNRTVYLTWENRLTKAQRERISEYAEVHQTDIADLLFVKP